MHLTFQESDIPLAVIKGGKYDGDVLFVSNKADDPGGKKKPQGHVDYTPFLKGYSARERTHISARLNKAFLFDREPEADIAGIYNQVKSGTDLDKKLELDDGGTIHPLPDPKTRSIIYCFGASGSGKSTFVTNYVKEWKKMFPKQKVYVFSRLADDPSLDSLKPKRVMIDDTLGDDKLSAADFKDSFVIFDDVDSLPKNHKAMVNEILDDILQTGRHFNVYCAVTSHLGSDYRATRQILNETHGICMFPQGSSPKAIKYILETYGGLDSNEVKAIMRLPSRWVYLKKNYPMAVLYNSGAYLLRA